MEVCSRWVREHALNCPEVVVAERRLKPGFSGYVCRVLLYMSISPKVLVVAAAAAIGLI